MMELRPYLEPIQEESEQDDEISGSETGDGYQESLPFQIGVETQELMAEDEREEEDGSALRSRRLPRSLSRKNLLETQSSFIYQEETENFTVSDSTTNSVAVSKEATAPGSPRLVKLTWPSSGKPAVKVRQQGQKSQRQSVQKKIKRERHKKESLAEMFPRWLVDLMFNIDEATTHQLVVE
ncbi:hypothetical protein EXN66_Car015084 [Channa argus]|uniref:Uncharacterized protein n=1 Tax=Channa argus TaxID=215402 RepID=A0A6G1QA80_CHAAH|nr:hypothetical protein EXN66_Car015084 [Channa argus]